jgi:hypothetical protein
MIISRSAQTSSRYASASTGSADVRALGARIYSPACISLQRLSVSCRMVLSVCIWLWICVPEVRPYRESQERDGARLVSSGPEASRIWRPRLPSRCHWSCSALDFRATERQRADDRCSGPGGIG